MRNDKSVALHPRHQLQLNKAVLPMLRACSVPNAGPNGADVNSELDSSPVSSSSALLSVALLNARSIVNEIDLLPFFVTNHNVSIQLVTETWWLRECYTNSVEAYQCRG